MSCYGLLQLSFRQSGGALLDSGRRGTESSIPTPRVTRILRIGRCFDTDSLLDEPSKVSLTLIHECKGVQYRG